MGFGCFEMMQSFFRGISLRIVGVIEAIRGGLYYQKGSFVSVGSGYISLKEVIIYRY